MDMFFTILLSLMKIINVSVKTVVSFGTQMKFASEIERNVFIILYIK